MKIYKKTLGQGAQQALYLHCSLAHHGAFAHLFDGVLDQYSVTMFDLPCHGRSGDSPEHTDIHTLVTQVARDMIDGPTHVVGHSFGATVALRLAVEGAPITGMTLIEPVLFAATRGTADFQAYQASFVPLLSALDAGDKESAARMFLRDWGVGLPWDKMPGPMRVQAMRSIHMIRDSASAVDADEPGVLLPGRLEALDIPVTLIEGARSPAIIGQIQSALAQRLPQGRRVVVDGAGHMVPLSHPAQVRAEIERDLGLFG